MPQSASRYRRRRNIRAELLRRGHAGKKKSKEQNEQAHRDGEYWISNPIVGEFVSIHLPSSRRRPLPSSIWALPYRRILRLSIANAKKLPPVCNEGSLKKPYNRGSVRRHRKTGGNKRQTRRRRNHSIRRLEIMDSARAVPSQSPLPLLLPVVRGLSRDRIDARPLLRHIVHPVIKTGVDTTSSTIRKTATNSRSNDPAVGSRIELRGSYPG